MKSKLEFINIVGDEFYADKKAFGSVIRNADCV